MRPTLIRRVALRFAFSVNPLVVQKAMKKLESAVGQLVSQGAGDGKAYYEALDAYRDVLYFLGRFLDPSDFQEAKAKATHLNMIVKHPLQPIGDPDFYKRALGEVTDLAEILSEALVMESYERGRTPTRMAACAKCRRTPERTSQIWEECPRCGGEPIYV